MKILAFSDLHRDKQAAQDIVYASTQADLVIGAGDFATKGIGTEDTFDILKNLTVPFLLVPGNHDIPEALQNLCGQFEHIHYLHGTVITLGGIDFFGLGLEIPGAFNADWNMGLTEEDAANHLAGCPEGAVLITHAPPYGIADLQKDGSHEGSQSIRSAVEGKKPRLHLCGHIHQSWGTSGTLAGCTVHNLGPTVNFFEV